MDFYQLLFVVQAFHFPDKFGQKGHGALVVLLLEQTVVVGAGESGREESQGHDEGHDEGAEEKLGADESGGAARVSPASLEAGCCQRQEIK